MLKIFQINDRHQMTEPRTIDNKQDKYQKIYTYTCHIQTTENQRQRERSQGGGLIYRGTHKNYAGLFRNHLIRRECSETFTSKEEITTNLEFCSQRNYPSKVKEK